MRSIGRWAAIPALPALALVLVAAGPSVGDRIAAATAPAPPPVTAGPCADDRAVLVAVGADGALFRCAGGVPVPRPGPWSTQGCHDADDPDEATLLASRSEAWQPATVCLIAAPVSGGSATQPATRNAGR